MTAGAPRDFHPLAAYAAVMQNGASAVLIGRGDAANGWRPSTGIPTLVQLVRLYAKCNIATLGGADTVLDVTVWNGGMTAGVDDVFAVQFDLTSGSGATGWVQLDTETVLNASALLDPADVGTFLIVDAVMNGTASGRVTDFSMLLEARRILG